MSLSTPNTVPPTSTGGGLAQFIPGSVRIIDYDSTSGNVLVRGSAAFGTTVVGSGTTFQMSDLCTAIQNDANFSRLPSAIQTTIKAATAPFVVDFCLIGYGSHKDEKLVTTEADYFSPGVTSPPKGTPPSQNYYPYYINGTAKAVSAGTMVYWPVQSFGGTNSVCAAGNTWQGFGVYPDLSILSTSQGQYGYDFAGLVTAMNAALTNDVGTLPSGGNGAFPLNSITNSIIYIHCDSGVNRTGAAIVSYLMVYGSNLLQPHSDIALAPRVAAAQMVANSAAPKNDTVPAGGNDLVVAIAYCNYFYNTSSPKTASGPLCAEAVPIACPYCPHNKT